MRRSIRRNQPLFLAKIQVFPANLLVGRTQTDLSGYWLITSFLRIAFKGGACRSSFSLLFFRFPCYCGQNFVIFLWFNGTFNMDSWLDNLWTYFWRFRDILDDKLVCGNFVTVCLFCGNFAHVILDPDTRVLFLFCAWKDLYLIFSL